MIDNQVLPCFFRFDCAELFERDKACKRRNQRSATAYVDGNEQRSVVVRKTRKQYSRRNVAYELAAERARKQGVFSSKPPKNWLTAGILDKLPENMKNIIKVSRSA